ncbi:MAG TPA: rRNA maturation RNase YbeY [Sulfurovum sp.]|jgi:probable rRNA maturation factor|nr:MAG: rRNA maturation RNase YbeY [Sulfurovum sp. 35-42-20]OYY57238.1 MAG: rRNA maturation RNase YbeY [Sulfurovum sp. 28-43-6]OYZ25410.1 MAG: rRNA maturation RNase YbeY [Sulfurovum sp. 16-42-52]OYZ49879.1 MAG: rRNA maturation RNase YbeY [Sulfurovum sp. 24-42-9]OZA45511.1 MAG: rRNA maturation RNase YbeY [Sulfurovum sp. 17-42-90]OZA59425.1 MAG: rRNA maturation RNase YbeY [Sulfurovum sp. 39-42-12]HQR74055.1 rRNA maturation RNase YbeY [Sulfurovum sp.]
MIDLDNQSTLDLDIEALEKIALSLTNKEVELIITDDATIQTLNHAHRGKDTPTDVLSFPLEIVGQDMMPLGSIVIAESFVRDKAIELGHTPQEELSLLFIHGMLHLLGYDHENDEGQMREKEKALIEQFGLPQSLIIRTQE